MLIISGSSKGGGREKSVEKRGLRRKNQWENQRKRESYKLKHNYHFSPKAVLVPVSISTEWWND